MISALGCQGAGPSFVFVGKHEFDTAATKNQWKERRELGKVGHESSACALN